MKNSFIAQKQQEIEKNLLLKYEPKQITYFNENIQQTISIMKVFHGIQDEGYINGLIRPYMLAHPELIDYIMQQKS
jgi:hypothetical protein